MVDRNRTQAAIRVGYSEKSAEVQGSRLYRNAKVRQRINELTAAQEKRVEVNSDEILQELKRLGYSDIRILFDEQGALKPIKEWPDDVARAVASVKVREEFEDRHRGTTCEQCSRQMYRELVGYTKEVKFWSKNDALNSLGKHKKLFTEKHEHSGPDGKPIELKAIPKDDKELDARIAALLEKRAKS